MSKVFPVKAGAQTLYLHVTVRIRLPYGEEHKDHPVLDRTIQVQVNSLYSLKQWFVAHWQSIIGTLMIPLIGWLWTKLHG